MSQRYIIRDGSDTIEVSREEADYLVREEVISRCRKCSTALDPEFHTEYLDSDKITLEDIKRLLALEVV